jgi:serine O-acetyltransferase
MKKKPDPIWETIRQEATEGIQKEPVLASFLHAVILSHKCLEDALSFQLASKLESVTLPGVSLRELIDEAFANEPLIGEAIRADLMAVRERDPACRMVCMPLLYFKGFQALQAYRVGHYYWNRERNHLALFLQSRVSDVFAVDIHPAARIGKGILIDHATGVVIGETAVVGNNVSMLHAVTLGGTGKERGDRHPKVQDGVLIAAGAKVLGNVIIGKGAKVASGAVVLQNVAPHTTVAGVPAKPIGPALDEVPALVMDQFFDEGGGV